MPLDTQSSMDARAKNAEAISEIDEEIATTTDANKLRELQNKRDRLTNKKWYKNKYWYKVCGENSKFYKVMDHGAVKGLGLGLALYNMRDANLTASWKNYADLTSNSLATADAGVQVLAKMSTRVLSSTPGKFLLKKLGPAAAYAGAVVNVWEGFQLANAGDTDASVAMFIAGAAAIGTAIPNPFTPLCFLISIGATWYAETHKDDKMEKFLKNIPFSNRADLDYSDSETWKANKDFYHTAYDYGNEDYPFESFIKENDVDVRVYNFLQAHFAFVYTQGRGFNCIEVLPGKRDGFALGTGAKTSGKSAHTFYFNNFVKGYLSTYSLPISGFKKILINGYFIEDGRILKGGYDILSVISDIRDLDECYYEASINGIGTAKLISYRNDIALEVRIVHSSGLILPFKKDEWFCVKLRGRCSVLMNTWTGVSEFTNDDMEWDKDHKNQIPAEKIKNDTHDNLVNEHTF